MRRKHRNRILVLTFFVFVGIVIALESPLTRIRTINVVGSPSASASRIISESKLKPGMSLWQINQSAVQAAIRKQEPVVDAVHVHTDYLKGHVTLQVLQKNVVAVFVEQGKYYNVLNDGTVYNEINGNSGFQQPLLTSVSSIPVTVGRPVANASAVELCKQLVHVSANNLADVSEIQVDKLGTATLFLSNGFEVRLSIDDFAATMPQVKAAVDYFIQQGYKPGMLDMSGQPPYLYSPLQANSGKGN